VTYKKEKEVNSVEGVEGCLFLFLHITFITFISIPEIVYNSAYHFLKEEHRLFQTMLDYLIHLMPESTREQ